MKYVRFCGICSAVGTIYFPQGAQCPVVQYLQLVLDINFMEAEEGAACFTPYQAVTYWALTGNGH